MHCVFLDHEITPVCVNDMEKISESAETASLIYCMLRSSSNFMSLEVIFVLIFSLVTAGGIDDQQAGGLSGILGFDDATTKSPSVSSGNPPEGETMIAKEPPNCQKRATECDATTNTPNTCCFKKGKKKGELGFQYACGHVAGSKFQNKTVCCVPSIGAACSKRKKLYCCDPLVCKKRKCNLLAEDLNGRLLQADHMH